MSGEWTVAQARPPHGLKLVDPKGRTRGNLPRKPITTSSAQRRVRTLLRAAIATGWLKAGDIGPAVATGAKPTTADWLHALKAFAIAIAVQQ